MKYDRCKDCKSVMEFHAITIVRGEWRRWVQCPKCSLLTNATEYGMMASSTRTPPTKGMIPEVGR